MKYDCYKRVGKREILREELYSHKKALQYMQGNPRFCFVRDQDGNEYYSEEELKNAKNIRSKHRTRLDYEITERGEILENTDRELSGTDTDRTESGSERDS